MVILGVEKKHCSICSSDWHSIEEHTDNLMYLEVEIRKQALEEVKMMIDERYFEDRKIGKGTGRFWEEFKQQINKLEENGKNKIKT